MERIHDIVEKSNMVLVWLPVLDKPEDWKKDEKKGKDNTRLFEKKRDLMPWHVVRKPQYLDPTIIAFIKSSWKLEKTSKIMVFDSEGRLEKEDALPMILVWGSLATPFTTSREDELWRSEKDWKLELLLTDPMQNDLGLKVTMNEISLTTKKVPSLKLLTKFWICFFFRLKEKNISACLEEKK